jgi:TRAP-type uncharacterized transport system substrate-binding protein
MDDQTVYTLVKSVHGNLALFNALHPAFAALNSRDMATIGLTAPLHPGARRAFLDLGILK